MIVAYALDIWESGAWRRLGVRKTRRGIVSLANRRLSTGYSFRIQTQDDQGRWYTSNMNGVRGYGS